MNQKTVIAILGVVVIILLGTTVYFATINKVSQPVAPASKVVQQPVTTTPSSTQPTVPTVQTPQSAEDISWKTYTNKTAGYQVTLPDAWKGYEAGDAGIGHTEIEFSFARPNVEQFNLFTLIEVSRASYKQAMKDAGYVFVGENSTTSKNVVMCTGPCCNGGAGLKEFDDFQKARCAEVPAILKTFKATN